MSNYFLCSISRSETASLLFCINICVTIFASSIPKHWTFERLKQRYFNVASICVFCKSLHFLKMFALACPILLGFVDGHGKVITKRTMAGVHLVLSRSLPNWLKKWLQNCHTWRWWDTWITEMLYLERTPHHFGHRPNWTDKPLSKHPKMKRFLR